MVGTTLRELHDRIDALASEEGRYFLRCARTGERPVPATFKRFPDRTTAARAARAVEQYRAALRRYDPRAPCYDVIACEAAEDDRRVDHDATTTEGSQSPAEPVVASKPIAAGRRQLVAYCHDVAAAVFESLAAGGYDSVESAVMDAYFDLAEELPDPDDLCLCLLESMAVEIDQSLTPAEQDALLEEAGDRMGPLDVTVDPVVAAFAQCEEIGIVESYDRSPWSIDADGVRSVTVDVERYALSPNEDRLPVLPIVLGLFRCRVERHHTRFAVTERGEGWRITVELGRGDEPDGETTPGGGLVCAPIEEGQ